MDIKNLYENLKKVQEPKGYYFNKDLDLVYELLDSLINNKDIYGYMACPCRLACGDKVADKDIICPCEYREADVKSMVLVFAAFMSLNLCMKARGSHDMYRKEDRRKKFSNETGR